MHHKVALFSSWLIVIIMLSLFLNNQVDDNTPSTPPVGNYYVAARGHIQRAVDVALIMSNMSHLATLLHRQSEYKKAELHLLVSCLILSITAQVYSNIVAHDRKWGYPCQLHI